MKKNDEKMKKLQVSRESLRVLSSEKELNGVAGGYGAPSQKSYCFCPL